MNWHNTRESSHKPFTHWPALLAALFLSAAPVTALAKNVLVIVPESGAETMLAAGRIRDAVLKGDQIKVVIATNRGDTEAQMAAVQAESVAAAQTLGLTEDDVVFLGYCAEALNSMYYNDREFIDGTTYYGAGDYPFTSPSGYATVYASRGLGRTDYHHVLTQDPYSPPVACTRNNFIFDFGAILWNVRPDEVYTSSHYDKHPEYKALGRFVTETIADMLGREPFDIKLYQGIVWMHQDALLPGGNWEQGWPRVNSGGFTPALPFAEPPACPAVTAQDITVSTLNCADAALNLNCLDACTPLEWNGRISFPVPAEMQSPTASENLKYRALQQYHSQFSSWLTSFARRDEIFWLTDFGSNLAMQVMPWDVSFSSEDWDAHGALKVKDGLVDGWPHGWKNEWVSGVINAPGVQPWVEYAWFDVQSITQVNLYDRLRLTENVLSGHLTFSRFDWNLYEYVVVAEVSVGALPPNGKPYTVTFPTPVEANVVRFTIDTAEGTLAGLAEMQVLGQPTYTPHPVPPHFVRGPLPDQTIVDPGIPVRLDLAVADLNGDPITVEWVVTPADGSVETGGDGVAYFYPPYPEFETVYTITARISDPGGLTAENSTYVTVRAVPQ